MSDKTNSLVNALLGESECEKCAGSPCECSAGEDAEAERTEVQIAQDILNELTAAEENFTPDNLEVIRELATELLDMHGGSAHAPDDDSEDFDAHAPVGGFKSPREDAEDTIKSWHKKG